MAVKALITCIIIYLAGVILYWMTKAAIAKERGCEMELIAYKDFKEAYPIMAYISGYITTIALIGIPICLIWWVWE